MRREAKEKWWERGVRMSRNYTHAIVLGCIVLLSFTITPGYTNSLGDQGSYYLPQIAYNRAPDMYGDDLLYRVRQTDLSFYDEGVEFIARAVGGDLYLALFILSAVFRTVLALAVYAIAWYVLRRRVFAWVVAGVTLLVPVYLYGTGLRIVEPWTEVRLVAFALGFSGIAFSLYKHHARAYVAVSCALLVHPVTSAVFLVYVYGVHVYDVWREHAWKTRMPWLALLPVCSAALLLALTSGGTQVSLLTVMDAEWKGVVQEELPAILFSSWGIASLLTLGASLVIFCLLFALFAFKARERQRVLVGVMVLAPVALFAVMFVAGDMFSSHLIVALQLGRGSVLLQVALIVLCAWWVLGCVQEKQVSRMLVFASIFLFIIYLLDNRWLVIILPAYLLVWCATQEMRLFAQRFGVWGKVVQGVGQYAESIGLAWLGICLTLAIAVYVYPEHMMAYFQIPLARAESFAIAFFVASVCAVVCVGYVAMLRNRVQFPRLARVSGVLVMCGTFLSAMWWNEGVVVYPVLAEDDDAVALCAWVRAHATPHDLMMVTQGEDVSEGYPTYLRVSCGATLYTAGEGGQSAFDREYAFEFVRRENVRQLVRERHPDMLTHLRTAGVRYFVTVEDLPHAVYEGETVVFASGSVRVYDLHENKSSHTIFSS